jgi:hypothetical protein
MVENTMTVLGTYLGFNVWIPVFEDRGPWKIPVTTVMNLVSIKKTYILSTSARILGWRRKTYLHAAFVS